MRIRPNRRILGTLPVLLAAVFFGLTFTMFPGTGSEEPLSTAVSTPPQPSAPGPKPPANMPNPVPEPVRTIQPLSERIVEYHIAVKLDADSKELHGSQSVTWTNPGNQSVQELYFHLYPNAFRSTHSTFNLESGGKLREDKMTADSVGHMDIVSISHDSGADLLHTMRYLQPDDGNEADQTLMTIKLPEAVDPGKSVTVKMDFTVKLPYIYARMGYADDFIMAGQWFPKLAVYEPKGRRGAKEEAWNLHQYHGNSEFYADFGIYNVKIDVPSGYIVAASGFPVKSMKDDGKRREYHYYAEDVHDFAWAASPHFVYAEEAFSTPEIPGVKIKLYLDPKHEHLQERYFRAAKQSLASFGKWYGSYPYSTLSIVVPPEGAGGAGGMEYPTLITAWDAKTDNPSSELERVIVHEIGHQFWYGMVANNEFEEAWLDEGFTSYVEDKVMESEYGMVRSWPILSSYMTAPAPLKLNSWEYSNHDVYAENVYARASLVLRDLEQSIGTKKMQQVLRAYFNRWKFDHPTTRDFQNVLERITHRSWDSYFKQFVYGDLMIDYAVTSVKSYEVEHGGANAYETRIGLARYGGVHRPVEIAIKLSDGSLLIETWDGSELQKELTIHSEHPADWVLVDPNFKQVLENRHYNNFMKASLDQKHEVRWTYGTTKVIELLFNLLAW